MTPVYDSADSIVPFYLAHGLSGLNRLMQDRMEAGYKRGERLHDFIIMGRWHADTCGNFGRCRFEIDYKPVVLPDNLPMVMTQEEAFRKVVDVSIITDVAKSGVPPHHVVCPECKKVWDLENAHDTFVRQEDRTVPLTPGKTIAEAERDYDLNTEGRFRFGPEPMVRNDKFIDLRPHPEYKNDKVNDKGWRYHHPPFNHERLTQQYVAEEGDAASITVVLYYHKRCWELRKSINERTWFEALFSMAGLKPVVVNEIQNEYCPCEHCAPWYVAKFPVGDIKIGWRKRVINIDWSATGLDLKHLFVDEDVTKEAHLIHAWGKDKAVDYLKRIKGVFHE